MAQRALRRAFVFFVAAWLVVAGPAASAGDERQKWWFSDWARSDLGLTDQQSREIEAVFQSLLPRMRAEKELFDRENATLTQLMIAGAGETAIGPAIDRVETARSAVNKTRTWMLVRMYRVLTPEQRVKLQARHERREFERRDSPGRGGPPR
jgi:Spy/CpxP family protein refolding chaperone